MSNLAEIVDRFSKARVMVIGDAMVDIYHFGRATRICPEAPVPVFVTDRTEERPGGARNVLHQVQALGANTYAAFAPEPITTKRRYVVGSHILLRVDDDWDAHPEARDVEGIRRYIASTNPDVIILSDYGRGWLSEEMCRTVIGGRIPVIVDPAQGTDWDKYWEAALICPNEKEYEGGPHPDFDILHKLGAQGMKLYVRTGDYGRRPGYETHIPAKAKHVYDVTGAGDTVVAVMATAIAAGAAYPEAAELAALAAGYVVGEVGTTVCPVEKLKELVNVG